MKTCISTVLFLGTILSITWAEIPSTDRFNYHFSEKLGGKCLTAHNVFKGMKIPLNSIITTPAFEKSKKLKPGVIITFKRGDLTEEFIAEFFDPQNRNVRLIHPFAARGVETVLRTTNLEVILYQGVGFHLRNDIQFIPEFKTFRSKNVTGVVTHVNGEVLISMDQGIIRERLGDVWTFQIGPRTPCILGENCFRREDGSFEILTPLDEEALLPQFPPRIEK